MLYNIEGEELRDSEVEEGIICLLESERTIAAIVRYCNN